MAEQLRRTKNIGLPPSQEGTRESEIFSIYKIEVVSNGGQTEYICSLGTGDFNNASVAQALEFYLEQNSDLNLGFRIITSGIWENIYDDYVFPFNDGSGFYKVKFRSLPSGAFDTNGEYGPLFLEFIVVDMAQYEPATQIDINGLVDFSYAGYKYGEDIPNRQCTVKVDIHPESLEVPLENPTIPGVCNWEVSVDDETPIEVNCPDISTKLQQIIDNNPGEVICLPEGLFKVEENIEIRSDSTVLRGDSAGTYLYFKSADTDTLNLFQHFGEECENYNDLPDMCNEVPGCGYGSDGCARKYAESSVFPKISVLGKGEELPKDEIDNGKIIENAPFGSNTIIVDSIYTLGEEIKCGDEITIKFEMTQDFIDEYNMSGTGSMFPSGEYAQEMDTWQKGKIHRMFRRRVTKPPEPIETSIEDDGDVPTSIIIGEDEVRSGTRRRQPKVSSWKLTFDVPLRHQIKTTYNPTIKHRVEPFVKESGLEDLFISNAIPYEYSQKKFKPYNQENFISNGSVVNFNNAKNCWIKNVNSFSPTDFNLQGATSGVSLMQYLYKITWEEEIGIPSAKNASMKNYFTDLFCAVAKAKTNLLSEDDQQYWWGRRLCNFTYNQSIWPEVWGRPGEGNNYWYFPSSRPGEPCKVHDYPLHTTQYGQVPDSDNFSFGHYQAVTGYPPPQFTVPIDSVKMLGDLPDSVAEVKFSEGFPFGFHHYWFPHYNIPNNVDLSEYEWQVRFVNTININDVGDWHNCGWKNNEEYCHTYTFFGIDLNQNTMLITNNTMSDSDGGGLPADAIGIEGMGVQLSLGGITDCSGQCVPKKLIGTHGVDEKFQSVNFCGIDPNPYPFVNDETGESFPDYSFDSDCCVCERLGETEFFPISYCDAPLWLGGADDLYDSEPVWLRKVLYNYNELDGTSTDYEWVDLPENSAFKEFNNFFDELGNPTNVPSMEEEPKHLRSSGIELDNCRNVTIKNCTLKLPQSKGGGGNGYLFNISAGNNDILIEDCEGYRGRHNFLSAGIFSNSGIVHNRVKSSGGWLWLNESSNLFGNPHHERTDDEWWSRYKQLEIMPGLGKPGFSDNHVGLTFGSLYTDSEIFDGIAWHNRLDNSGGAGITTVNSVLWNLKGHDGVANPSYENSSIPGMGMIQSYNAKDGFIFHGTGALSQNDLNYMYDVYSETDEELSIYFDYLNDLFGVGSFDDSFSQTIGIFTLFGNTLIESLLRDGLAIRFNGYPDGLDIGSGARLYKADLKLDSNADFNLEFNDATNRYTIEVLNKGLSGQVQVGVPVIGVYTLDVTSSGSLRIVLNLDTLELEEVDVNIVDYDVEIPGGWFPGKRFIEEVLIEWLGLEILADVDSIISNASIEEDIKNAFRIEVPVRLKKYRIGNDEWDTYGELENNEITEASGLVVSRQYDDTFWTHNDYDESGIANLNTIYAFNRDGLNIGEWTLTNLPMNQRDWEDMATFGTNLYIGEIGDNYRNYNTKFIYECPEPDVLDLDNREIECTSYEFTYNDKIKHDAETLMIDTNGDIYIITKHPIGTSGKSKVFKLGVDTISNTQINEAEFIMELDTLPDNPLLGQVVGGDISSNGSKILVLTYEKIFYFERLSGETIQEVLSKEPEEVTYNKEHPLEQGEAVAWDNNNNDYYAISEKKIPLNPLMKYIQETVGGFVNFLFGDYRQGTKPNDTYYFQPDIWDNDFPNYPSLYDIQKEIRLDLPISENLTLPMCDNDNPGEPTPDEDIPILVPGCMDDGRREYSPYPDLPACNYDPSANRDDGSCTYPTDYPHRCYVDLDGDGDYETPRMVYWCDRVLEGAPDYQSCEDYPGDYVSEENRGIIYGCTDFTACNYMSGATEDDGSCDYGIDYSGYDSATGYNCSHVNFIKDFIFSGNDEVYYMDGFQRLTFELWNSCPSGNLCLIWHDNGDLKEIRLGNQPMQGFIPESIGYVNSLDRIHFVNLAMQHYGRNGTFNADLPVSIGRLTNLQDLFMPGNRFGTLYSQGIPDEIGRLVNLRNLDMQPPVDSNFRLRGTIPQSMERLTNLRSIQIQRNKLEGEIPDIFGDMPLLWIIRAQDNQLEGFFPPSICDTYAGQGLDEFGDPVSDGFNNIFVADNYLCEPPPPDCLTGDDIQFDRQYFNEDCYEIEIPPIIEIDP